MSKANDLKHLSRAELLEILVAQSKRIDALEEENAELKKKLEKKAVTIEKCGSIAEAAVQLSGIFEAAQRAADIYLSSLEERCTDQDNAAPVDGES